MRTACGISHMPQSVIEDDGNRIVPRSKITSYRHVSGLEILDAMVAVGSVHEGSWVSSPTPGQFICFAKGKDGYRQVSRLR